MNSRLVFFRLSELLFDGARFKLFFMSNKEAELEAIFELVSLVSWLLLLLLIKLLLFPLLCSLVLFDEEFSELVLLTLACSMLWEMKIFLLLFSILLLNGWLDENVKLRAAGCVVGMLLALFKLTIDCLNGCSCSIPMCWFSSGTSTLYSLMLIGRIGQVNDLKLFKQSWAKDLILNRIKNFNKFYHFFYKLIFFYLNLLHLNSLLKHF